MRLVILALLALASSPASAQLTTVSPDPSPVVANSSLDDADANRTPATFEQATADSTPAPTPEPTNVATLGDLVDVQAQSSPSRDLHCMAAAIYFEARGETLAGQLAVGRVIVARTRSGRFPASYCGVVYQPFQFSFVRGRSMPAINTASRDWREAVAIAQIADAGQWRSPAEGALFFHAVNVSPRWKLRRVARVENHVFYQ